jgi:hypothetical protein
MFVMSYARPASHRVYPNNGKPHETAERAALEVVRVLGDAGHRGRAALAFARSVHARIGEDVIHEPSGIAFRVAPADVRPT